MSTAMRQEMSTAMTQEMSTAMRQEMSTAMRQEMSTAMLQEMSTAMRQGRSTAKTSLAIIDGPEAGKDSTSRLFVEAKINLTFFCSCPGVELL